jgi:hypothetical protein
VPSSCDLCKNLIEWIKRKYKLEKAVKMKVGDKVIKNEETWKPNDFDSWGRGIGVGTIVEPPFELDDDEVDVRWPNGRCFEFTHQLRKVN